MKLRAFALRSLLVTCVVGSGCGKVAPSRPDPWSPASEPTVASPTWYSGTFRYLPSAQVDLVSHISSRTLATSYTAPSATRAAAIATMMSSIFAALDASLTNDSGDWCKAISDATMAGYALQRLRDGTTGRWFLHGYDTTGQGGAYFWIDPEPGRNIVVEAPHAGFDTGTQAQSARMFPALAARAMIMNGATRCASRLPSGCTGTTDVCTGGAYRQSDVTHDSTSAFYLLHAALDDRYGARFVQLHQNVSSGELVIATDGTTTHRNPASVSVAFEQALSPNVSQNRRSGHVVSCQAGATDLCGTYNVAGRHTNGAPDACTGALVASIDGGRFLHVEQDATMTDTNCEAKGHCWTSVRDALLATWGAPCTYNGCALGPSQASVSDCACGTACGTNGDAGTTEDATSSDADAEADSRTADSATTDSATTDSTVTDSASTDTAATDSAATDTGSDATATTDTLVCAQLTVTSGSVDGASGACTSSGELATVDEKIAVWNGPAFAYATYRSPVGASSISAIRLVVTYNGDDGTEPLWVWSVRNNSGGWDYVGDSSFAGNWVWSSHTFTIPNPAQHVNAANEIAIQFGSATSRNTAELDRMVVQIVH